MPDNSSELYELIKDLFFLVDDGDQRLFSRFGLTISRYFALVHIGRNPGISPVQLSGLMFCDKSNVTRLVRGLEGEGHVRRLPHEQDRRSIRLFLTPSGAALRVAAQSAHAAYNAERFQFLTGMASIRLDDWHAVRQQLQSHLKDPAAAG